MSVICGSCAKRDENDLQRKSSYFISDTDTSSPQSLLDIKVTTRNFVVQRNTKVDEVYERICFLGEGAFGAVYKVRRKNSDNGDIIRALKEINKESIIDGDEIKNEIEVLKNLDHPNIMKIYEFFEDNQKLYLINEFCGGGDVAGLNDKLGIFPEFLLKYIMFQVFFSISYLHCNKVVHGDLKRENISFVYIGKDKEKKEKKSIDEFFSNFFKDKEIQFELAEASGFENLSDKALSFVRELSNFGMKILDFGSARMKKKGKEKEKLSGVTGTVYYCSPEVIKDKYDFECDEWACGVMMYILLTGYPPFPGDDEEEVFNNIMNYEPDFSTKEFKEINNSCIDLIKKLLVKDANKRITADEALKHEFFTTGINVGNLLKGKFKENSEILKKIIKRMNLELNNKNKSKSKFKELVIAYIALNFSDEKEEILAKQLFMNMTEGDKNFIIRKETFVQKITQICRNLSRNEIEEVFDNIDKNENGNIEYEELIRALTDKEKLLSDKNLKEAFTFFDKDNSGSISWNEIAEIVYPEGKIPQNIIKEFLKEIGQKDENMTIDFQEFKKILQK